jgi:hypothetical protein
LHEGEGVRDFSDICHYLEGILATEWHVGEQRAAAVIGNNNLVFFPPSFHFSVELPPEGANQNDGNSFRCKNNGESPISLFVFNALVHAVASTDDLYNNIVPHEVVMQHRVLEETIGCFGLRMGAIRQAVEDLRVLKMASFSLSSYLEAESSGGESQIVAPDLDSIFESRIASKLVVDAVSRYRHVAGMYLVAQLDLATMHVLLQSPALITALGIGAVFPDIKLPPENAAELSAYNKLVLLPSLFKVWHARVEVVNNEVKPNPPSSTTLETSLRATPNDDLGYDLK